MTALGCSLNVPHDFCTECGSEKLRIDCDLDDSQQAFVRKGPAQVTGGGVVCENEEALSKAKVTFESGVRKEAEVVAPLALKVSNVCKIGFIGKTDCASGRHWGFCLQSGGRRGTSFARTI